MRAAMVFVLLVGLSVRAQQSPKPLFRAVSPPNTKFGKLVTADGAAFQPQGVVRKRLITVDRAQLAAFSSEESGRESPHRLLINLFDDTLMQVLVNSVTRQQVGMLLSGTTVENGSGSVQLIAAGRHLTANVITGDGKYFQIRPTSDESDIHVVEQLDSGQLPRESPPIHPRRSKVSRDFNLGSDTGEIIDVMIVYTQATRLEAGGHDAVLGLISLAAHDINESFERSGIVERVRIVHSEEVNFEPSATFGEALEALSNQSDPRLKAVRELRDQYGADMVSFWITNLQSCGLAYVWSDERQDFSDNAFSVVNWHCAVFPSQWSFAHELGHNQGTGHDRNNASPGLYPFSFGYQQTRTAPYCRTIEAYPCDGGRSCPRVNLWSNPEIHAPCYPLGIPSSLPDAADDRETLNRTRIRAARWRNSTVPETSLRHP